MLSGFNLTTEDATRRILEEHVKRAKEDDEDDFGVHLDEYSTLIDEEDVFDATEDIGPCPAFIEACTEPVEFCTVETGERPLTVLTGAFNMIRPGYTVILYGPRRSGKSKFIRHICQRIRPWFPDVICFTKTKASGEYFSFLPYDHVIDGLDEDLLMALMKNQRKIKMKESRGEFVGNYNLLVIIDDCMAEKLRYKDIFNMVFFNGRHYNITLLVTVQDVKGVAPSATINADMAFSFSLPDRRGRETVREKFADYLTRNEFDALFDSDEINKKYHIVGFDIAHRYNPIERRISIGCCDPKTEEPFVMGDRHMWNNSLKQLMELGHGHLIQQDHWDIVQPKGKPQTKPK